MPKKNTTKNTAASNATLAIATPSALPGQWPHGPNAPANGPVLVTPEVAAEWLKANTRNRRPRASGIARAKSMLLRGKFKFNGQTVVFTKSWFLGDGQHRLIAIVETGIAAWILVWTGIDDDALETIDVAVAGDRTPAEAHGIKSGNGTPPKDEVARVNACWTAIMNASTRTAEEYGLAAAAFLDGIRAVAPCFTAHNVMCRSSIAAGFALAWKIGGDAVVDLARKYMSGEGFKKGDPMLVLTRWTTKPRKRGTLGGGSAQRAWESRVVLSLVLDALSGTPRKILRHASEDEMARIRKAHGL